MENYEFERIIGEAVRNLPKEFKKILKEEGIELLARDRTPGTLQKKYAGGYVFGVFIGVPRTKRSVFSVQQEPTRIELYRESFEKAFSGESEIKAQIVKTVIHEVGHFFGFSEEELRKFLR